MKIGFVTLTDPQAPAPSTRVAVLNMLPYLHEAGHETAFLYTAGGRTPTPELPPMAEDVARERFDLVVFQKVHGPSVLSLVRALERRRIRTIYVVCDFVDAEMAAATSATVVVTEYLRSLYPAPLRHKVHVVHDGIERPQLEAERPPPQARRESPVLRAVLVTAASLDHLPVLGNRLPPWLHITVVGRYPAEAQRWERLRVLRWTTQRQPDARSRLEYLRFALHPRIRLAAWDPEGVYRHLMEADVGIIPVDTEEVPDPAAAGVPSWKVRSENRLTLKMALGLPVIATPIPAYEPIVEQGVNGFLARSPAEWWAILERLRDPALRHRVGDAARRSVLAPYSKDHQAERLLAVLQGVAGAHAPALACCGADD